MAGIGNRVVLGVLRSPARSFVDSGLCALRYRANGGAVVSLPVQYRRTGDGIVVRSGRASTKRWWRHFWRPAPVEVWLDGAWRPGTARVTDVDEDADIATVRVVVGAAPLRGNRLFRTWVPVVAAAELAGFAVPAVAGAVSASAPGFVALAALVPAGLVEGAFLGWGQASVLRRALPGFPVRRWVGWTAAAAAFVYLLVMLLTALGAWWVLAVLAVPLLLSIGVAQWWVLRDRVPWARPWIAVTAAAWLAGLAVFLAFATPLWWSGQAPVLTVLVGVAGGALMATTVAAVTGLALRTYLR